MKPFEHNPRKLTKKKAHRLEDTLARLGDLSGVVHELNTGQVAGGHQRLRVMFGEDAGEFRVKDGDIEYVTRFEKPDPQGTVAQGFILWRGYRYAYRETRWNEEDFKEANIAANVGAGTWDWEELANAFDAPDLMEWRFSQDTLTDWKRDVGALGNLLGSEEEGEPADTDSGVARQTLAERFGVPPFSVLDARQGYWQKRKSAWLSLGIKSEIGRGANLGAVADNEAGENGILTRTGKYAVSRPTAEDFGSGKPGTLAADYKIKGKAPADSGGSLMPLDRRRGAFAPPDGSYDYPVEMLQNASGTSIFDPVLCELAYRWFTPSGGTIIDPFAGGSVRGVVASLLGYEYTGLDLRSEQVEANRVQADEICQDKKPCWHVGDSVNIQEVAMGQYDFIFSCPPYGDLEIYSEDPADLSNMDFDDFIVAYKAIIKNTVALLKDNRFACFVVGDFRDKKGFYRNFPAITIEAFHNAGMTLYNEAILVTAVGSLSIRVGRQFQSGRKLGKTHQNVLVFYKGDPKKIKETYGEVEISDTFTEEGQ